MDTSLTGYIEPEAIVLDVAATDSKDVINVLASRLEKLGYVRPSYAAAVLAREAAMPTGLPLGLEANVAVPHTDPHHVIKPGIAFASLARPVDFANMENPDEAVPVGLVFMLALNDKDAQIDMLQRILETIQDPHAIEALRSAKTPDDVLRQLAGT